MKDGRRFTAVDSASLVHGLRVFSPGRRRRSTSWFHRFGLPTDDWRLISSSVYRRPSTLLLLSVICLLTSVFFNCSSPTPPPPPPPPSPDTTSHEFIWHVDTVGDGNASAVYDVAIFNDTTVWAVGEMYLKDSLGQIDPTPYNLAAWNGREWNLRRVPSATYGGPEFSSPLHAIVAFSANDVWTFSIAGSYSRWNGSNWTTAFVSQRSGSVTKMWGSSSSDLYAVGTNGSLSRFSGSTWTLLASGTTVDLVDVWGTGRDNVWVAGYDLLTGQTSVLLHGSNGIFEKRYEYIPPFQGNRSDSITGAVTSVWTSSTTSVWAIDGARAWELPQATRGNGTLRWEPSDWVGFLMRIRGSGENNIFTVGHYGSVLHHNGGTWHSYPELANPLEGRLLRSLDVRTNMIVVVGSSGGQGIAIRGTPR